jgi:DNA adenine methylase
MMLPKLVQKIVVPPIKCQGIKTKLVPFIFESIKWNGNGRWIEPFAGSGVVLFNLKPASAIFNDINHHIVRLYKAIFALEITPPDVEKYLVREGNKLFKNGQKDANSYYYEVRRRFNKYGDSLDLLFLSRACFNGVMRFNKKGEFNVPFCQKPDRFRRAHITKIVNQVLHIQKVMSKKNWEFTSIDWRDCLTKATRNDFVYIDPPYIGRHVDYYNSWTEKDATDLAKLTNALPCGFAVSMWSENKYRKNSHIEREWSGNVIRTFSHFYHVGSKESLRNSMQEALIIPPRFAATQEEYPERIHQYRLATFERSNASQRYKIPPKRKVRKPTRPKQK